MDLGWIKLHRKLLNCSLIRRPRYLQLWITLLLLANHKRLELSLGSSNITLQPGQLVTTRQILSEITGIAPSTIEYILNCFEQNNQIHQRKSARYRIISIQNWHRYQRPSNRTEKDEPETILNEYNNWQLNPLQTIEL